MAQEKNEKTPEEKTTQKHGFFQRMKEKYGGGKEETQPAEEIEEEPETEPEVPPLPEGRGVITVSEQSMLYILWREWAQTEKGTPLFLILEKPEDVPAPLDAEAMEAEKQRMLVKLLMESKKRHRQIHPKRAAEMTAEEREAYTPPDLDADMVIYLAKDAMAAWMMLFPPSGAGEGLHQEEMRERLEIEAVVAGIDEVRLAELAAHPVYFDPILIARGEEPIAGKDGWVKEYFERELENHFAMDEAGNVDYHAARNMQVVHEGDVICEAFPPTEGTPGKKVTGTELAAEAGKEVKLPRGKNTRLNEEGNQLLASKDGSLQFIRECFCVQPLCQIAGDVDYSVGNIDFPGDVHIFGDVRNGFVVKAKGDIVIDGLVEGAVLEAGGNISIRKGVLGDDRAMLRAKKSISAQYLENCVVYAEDKVETSSIITSEVNSDNAIIVRVGRGTIIGGKMIATHLISANVIGCRAERLTELSIGEVPLLKQERADLLNDLEKLKKDEYHLENNINYLDVDMVDEEPEKARNRVRLLAKFRLERSVLMVQKGHLLKKLEDLKQKETDASKCKVICDTMYPVTKVYFGDECCTVKQETKYCTIRIKDGAPEIDI